jgi:endonuclease III
MENLPKKLLDMKLSDMKPPDKKPLESKVLEIHRRLCVAYECPVAYFHSLDPLSELVSSLLSHRTRNADSGRAFKALRAAYPDWAAVRDAPADAIQETISGVTWPEQKAPRIQQVLRAITERRSGDLSLDFLADLGVTEARAWLESLSGVGPKTSAAVLSFSTLRRPALPVDSHHHRVAVRTGMIPATLAVGPAHAVLSAQLPPEWTAQQIYDNHEVMMLHGQRCCFFRSPACGRCVLLDLCPTGRARVKPTSDQASDQADAAAATSLERNSLARS